MKVFFATDHAGFELKEVLLAFVRDELGFAVEDCGALTYDESDDYPDYIKRAAEQVTKKPNEHKAIVLGASGQGEAIVANRFVGVRAVVFYGAPQSVQTDAAGEKLSLVASSRLHNDANVLSLGARFVTTEEAKAAVRTWLQTDFAGDERHVRRIKKIDGQTP